jgi:hypothetical protein
MFTLMKGRHMQIEDQSIQQRVNQRLSKMRRFFIHLMFMIGGTIAFGVAGNYSDALNDYAGIVIPLLIFSFIAHAVWFGYTEAADRMIQEELARHQYMDSDNREKPKRSVPDRLIETLDGEVLEVIDEPADNDSTRLSASEL